MEQQKINMIKKMNEKKKMMVWQQQNNKTNKFFAGPWTKSSCI